jgi:hypothetical protein
LPLSIDNYNDVATTILPALNQCYKDQYGKYKNMFVGTNNFTNQTIQHCILNKILKDSPNYVYQYDAFVCSSGTYNITKFSNEGTLPSFLIRNKDNINDEFIIDMIMQILEPLNILKSNKYSFNHNDLKLMNVFVNQDSSNNITYQIADFDKSSITWNGVRFYNNNYDYSLTDSPPFPPETYNGNLVYRVSNKFNLFIQVYIMHYYRGIYTNHDIYTLFISFLLEPVFYEYVINNVESRFWNMWELLWIDHADMVTLNNRIAKEHAKYLINNSHIRNMRSIAFINKILVEENVKLRVSPELTGIMLNLQSEHEASVNESGSSINELRSSISELRSSINELGSIYITKGNNICIDDCDKSTYFSRCHTNKHSGFVPFGTHDWDYC